MKKIILITIIAITASYSGSNFCNYDKIHPIKKWNKIETIKIDSKEINNSQFTKELISLEEIRYKKWDSELEKVYKILDNLLSIKDKKLLKESQNFWIQSYEKEMELFKNSRNDLGDAGKLGVLGHRTIMLRDKTCSLLKINYEVEDKYKKGTYK